MRAAVIGAGIIGVTTAYELAADGHQVTVFERHGAVAAEASFANAGQVSPGYSAPWAGPGIPLKAIKWLLMRHRPGDPSFADLKQIHNSANRGERLVKQLLAFSRRQPLLLRHPGSGAAAACS